MTVKLAELLLRRKELQGRLDRLNVIKRDDFLVLKTKRINVAEGIDEVTASVPKCDIKEACREYDFCAQQLRKCDGEIQRLNWATETEVDAMVFDEYHITCQAEAKA